MSILWLTSLKAQGEIRNEDQFLYIHDLWDKAKYIEYIEVKYIKLHCWPCGNLEGKDVL